jgi:transcriptional regulator with XRE-family HTH domain
MGRTLDQVLGDLPKDERDRVEERTEHILAEVDTLKALRHQLNIPQAHLARSLGVSEPTVSETETKPAYNLSLAALDEYVRALGGRLEVTVSLPDRPPVSLERFADLVNDPEDDPTGPGS